MKRLAILAFLCIVSWSASSARHQRPLLPTTEDVRFIADQYMDGLPELGAHEEAEQVRAEFVWFFLRGLTNPDGAVSGSDAAESGFSAGRSYRRLNPERLERTMYGFGYTTVKLRGTWHTGFELSGFTPVGQPNARWWLSIVGDSPASKSRISPSECGQVHVTGFLSPDGVYGHMGGFSRELYVREIKCLGRANNSFKPMPLRGTA